MFHILDIGPIMFDLLMLDSATDCFGFERFVVGIAAAKDLANNARDEEMAHARCCCCFFQV